MFSGLSDALFGSIESPDIYGDIKSTMDPFFKPYVDAGTDSLGSLQDQIARMYQDPGALYSDLGKDFKSSPGYEYNVQQATQGANRAAAAGGQLGSPAEQQALAKQVGGMADQDYQSYMNSMMGLYGQGVQGLTGLTNLGYQSSSTEAEDLARAKMAQAGLDMGAQKANMQSSSSMFGDIAGLVGSL